MLSHLIKTTPIDWFKSDEFVLKNQAYITLFYKHKQLKIVWRVLSKSKPKLNYVKEFMNKFLFYAIQLYSWLLFELLNLKGYNMYI